MANFFDQFDNATKAPSPTATNAAGNYFDRFDVAKPQSQKDIEALQMEQPELAAKWGIGQPQTETRGNILPFARSATGDLSLAVPEAIAAPFRGLVEGGKRALGVDENGQNPLRPLSPDITAAATVAASPLRFMGQAERVAASPEAIAGRQAAKKLSDAFSRGETAGGPTAQDALERLGAAKTQKQPMTLADIENPELKALIGTVYRQGGAARGILEQFFKERNDQQLARMKTLIGDYLADGSIKDTTAQLLTDRATNARPLWDKAMAGGSLAPLEHQFENLYQGASLAEREALAAVANAEQNVTLAGAKQSQAGNVYSASAAKTTRKAADAALVEAKQHLSLVQQQKNTMLERLRRAQADGTANMPGAAWSPRLQQFLDQPEVQRGIQRGFAIERRKAVGEGNPFNPKEYAVIGTDSSGNPIVGEVPNMRLLAVAKEGLDAIIESPAMKNPLTGKPTKAGLSYIALRDGLVNELDRLNPAYKVAREQWSGDTASIRALNEGKHAFEDAWFTPEELAAHIKTLSPNDKQFFIMGVADKLKSRLARAVDTADKTRIFNNEDTRMRLRPLFGSEEDAQRFLDAVEREHTMKLTPQRLYGNSATAVRQADDKRLEKLLDVGNVLWKLGTFRPIEALHGLARLRGKPEAPNFPVNESIARMVTNPDLQLSPSGPVVPFNPQP